MEIRVLLCTGPGLAAELREERRRQALALVDLLHGVPRLLEQDDPGDSTDLTDAIEEARNYSRRFGNPAHEANFVALQRAMKAQTG